jgi:hypothetical protein
MTCSTQSIVQFHILQGRPDSETHFSLYLLETVPKHFTITKLPSSLTVKPIRPTKKTSETSLTVGYKMSCDVVMKCVEFRLNSGKVCFHSVLKLSRFSSVSQPKKKKIQRKEQNSVIYVCI